MAKVQTLKTGKFRVQITKGGRSFSKNLPTREEAEAYLAEHEGPSLTLDFFAKEVYFKSKAFLKEQRPNSQLTFVSRYKKISERLGKVQLANLTPMVIADYLESRQDDVTRLGKHPSNDTLRLEITVLTCICKLAASKGHITINPVREADRPSPTVRSRRVSQDERANLWKAARGEWPLPPTRNGRERGTGWSLQMAARFLLIQYELGCRASELSALPILHIDLTDMDYYLELTKAGVPQRRPLSPEAALLIREQMVQQAIHFKERGRGVYFLFSLQANPKEPYDYQYAVDLVREYGIVDKSYHSHANRRELVSTALEKEVDYETIMTITGLMTVATIKRYDAALKLTDRRRQKTNAFFQERYRDSRAKAQLDDLTGGSVNIHQLHEDAELAGLDLMFQAPGTGSLKALPKKKAPKGPKGAGTGD